MYFASRLQAGRMLGSRLTDKYRFENCAVVALNDGGVMVGAQIASQLHCVLMLLVSSEINIPQEPEALVGTTDGHSMVYNKHYSQSQIDEFSREYSGYIDQEKRLKMHEMNRLIGEGGIIDKNLLKGHNVIVVSDGLQSGFPLDIAADYLKQASIDRLIVATPLASVEAVDSMHVTADEIYCLNVVENIREIDHYYDANDVPEHSAVIKVIQDIITNWK